MTCSTECCEQSTRMVIRLRLGSWVGPTASESMLKPRRANSPAQRVSTPGRFSTSTERVWCVWVIVALWGLASACPRLKPPCESLRSLHPFLHPRVVILRPLHVDHLRGRGAGRHH